MKYNKVGEILFVLFMVLLAVTEGQDWRGNTEPYKVWQSDTCRRCICRYGGYCAQWRYFTCNTLVTKLRCLRGWRHRGDYNCNIPICRPNCGLVGECVAPGKCDCKGLAIGQYCQELICSYQRPCYPGNCYSNNRCNCTSGFTKESSASEYGCLKIDTNNKPYIGKSTSVIEHTRKTDKKFLFYFLLDGTDETMRNLIVWSNQRVFNIMRFTFEVSYEPPEPLAERPVYVHETKVGITEGKVLLRVLDYKNDEHPTQKYDINCPSSNPLNPQQLFNCTIENAEFKTLIEHADTLKVTFVATNGGYRQMTYENILRPEEKFTGQTSRKNVYFKFDFQAPKHCTEDDIGGYTFTDCVNSTMLHVPEEFTKEPIRVRWKGWTDDKYGSQMWMYYLELHKLVVKDATLELTELNPIKPMARNQTLHMGNTSHYQTFTPLEPGMYSILLEVRDIANNSRIARRFVLYDKESDVELNQKSPNGLHVSSAENHTGFKWQSAGSEGEITDIVVNWTGYFMNKAHEEGHYNNEIQTFKPQFEDLEDDGILYTRKFVNASLDDMEGERTRDPIANIHGIVKFEYQYTRDIGSQIPGAVWTKVEPISETTTIREQMSSGDQLKIRVRAYDVLGNTKMDSTIVTTDFTKPITSSADDNTTTHIVQNTNVKPFNYSSSVFLEAYDTESGVRDIGVNITIMMQGVSNISVSKMVKANTDDKRHPDRDSECVTSRDKTTCFLKKQTVNIDNCWLTVPNQALLSSASAIIDVIAYNQAMLPSSVRFTIPEITALDGLVSYNGPESARVENVKTGSFRIVWDFPTKLSCYAIQTSIILVLFKKSSNGDIELVTHVIPGSNTYFDVANLDSDTEYLLDFISQIGDKKNPPMKLTARTSKEPETGLSVGVVVGIAVGVLCIVALVIVIFIFLVRRGYVHPQERARRVKRAVTRKYRQTVYGESDTINHRHPTGVSNEAYDAEKFGSPYDNRKTMSEHEELYLYGGMDINMPEVEHIDRNDISFEGIIKDGHFARIYKATWRTSRGENTVVAKTLKDKFTPNDEMLMRAKINFTGTVVGSHPNVLKFLGAVVGDEQMGPFIVYEYCENGTLKDYLVQNKNNVTIELQEHLYRFGLDVAKGMEYLASKGIVHRRLAARNILLTFLNEIKISGFGPQPDESSDGDSEKQERIPIKWVAPECMTSTKDATERSDIWSYAVVLWEIFTLGETPYAKMRSRQLPVSLKKGERLPKPEQCDDTWYGVMKRCWEYDPHNRPLFVDVRSELDEMFVASPGDDYYYYKR
ncbi:uncharacterized protein LOC132751968 isoform X3 [Ruditapes philippinarum]|uniref:uncharacterized protein LOC132751968 isoform X3 n=1 Tax=Ruditapes philippinarum TaxID=129788 RepID=UPI00295B6115|nr:uncharacterized protein LOC132751968 isoform X3 [Ruditapes philippinarum]